MLKRYGLGRSSTPGALSLACAAALTVGLGQGAAPVQASMDGEEGQSRMPRPRAAVAQAHADDFVITARKAYLVGGEGKTDNSVRYDGSKIWYGPGHALVLVDERENSGHVLGTIRTHGHTYTILMHQFRGPAPFMSGGVAKNLFLHGLTGQGPPIFPRVLTYLAGWGKATVFKDDQILYEDFGAHFMLTQGVRDEATHEVKFPSAEDVQKLLTHNGEDGELKQIKHEIRESADAVNPTTVQLHIVAHSPQKDPESVPPFAKFIHFMFDEVTWH